MSSDLLRVLVPVVLLAGCSVKEDRSACPCTLVLDFSDLPVTPVMLSVEGEGCSVLQIVHADTLMTLSVPRTDLSVSVTGGALPDAAGSVRIPFGEEAPPLYLYHASVSSEAEQVVLPVYLRKQFCRLTLAFTGPPGYGPPFEVEVEGFVDGWARDGSPLDGPFSYRLLPEGDGMAVIRLPRQRDDSLLMHIVFSDQVVRTFALGNFMAAAGYDWSAADLEDLTLNVDVSVTSVTISTDAWTATEEIELFI
ncbi:MAG: hypothetical protein IJ755_02295 [Bacteroidales bacterium]|nr:hypothetical protein [Bacteroidales bacterium]